MQSLDLSFPEATGIISSLLPLSNYYYSTVDEKRDIRFVVFFLLRVSYYFLLENSCNLDFLADIYIYIIFFFQFPDEGRYGLINVAVITSIYDVNQNDYFLVDVAVTTLLIRHDWFSFVHCYPVVVVVAAVIITYGCTYTWTMRLMLKHEPLSFQWTAPPKDNALLKIVQVNKAPSSPFPLLPSVPVNAIDQEDFWGNYWHQRCNYGVVVSLIWLTKYNNKFNITMLVTWLYCFTWSDEVGADNRKTCFSSAHSFREVMYYVTNVRGHI